jgi:hypothetical protein
VASDKSLLKISRVPKPQNPKTPKPQKYESVIFFVFK